MSLTLTKPQNPALIFDFGGVLIDWNPRYLYRKVFADEQTMERFLAEVGFFEWNKLQDAGRPLSEAVADLCSRHPQHCELIRLYDERYEESLSGPIPASVAILSRLRAAGCKLYGLSNWPQEKFQLVRHKFEFFNWFDELFISGELGLAKPDPRIFRLVLQCLARPADQCLLIDDSTNNIAAAQALGLRTIHFLSPQQLENELLALGIIPEMPSSRLPS
jgi:2-haloacid dehalogenase